MKEPYLQQENTPHTGSLSRTTPDGTESAYAIPIRTTEVCHELVYTSRDFLFAQRLFSILDTESRGLVSRSTVKEFVTLRCPIFWRRDDDLRKLKLASENSSPTFDEIWLSVVTCSSKPVKHRFPSSYDLGVEAWMVFCRFVALAQYLEAKRRFSARHKQQTMRHRNAPRGSELIMVEVPPPEPPIALTVTELATYEQKSQSPLPLPELDLDHSLLAAHDLSRKRAPPIDRGMVKILLFGPSAAQIQPVSSVNLSDLEFVVTFYRQADLEGSGIEQSKVRRSMADMKWLDDTFSSHKVLGGTLCGRILPPFPGKGNRALSSHFEAESVINSSIKTTEGAIATAAKGVGKIRDVAKSFLGSYLSADGETLAPQHQKASREQFSNKMVPESYYNPNLPLAKARHMQRYLNYLLEHPALSTSFPLSTILKASQSGLEAMKQSLEECTKTTEELKQVTPNLDDGKLLISSFLPGASPTSQNLRWVRTAAQAAMALKVHGMLETTGMNSASARLQHASLPRFGGSRTTAWEDMDSDPRTDNSPDENANTEGGVPEGNNFEEGVVNVASNLQSEEDFEGEGYDLLPLPVPAPERTILNAGSEVPANFDPEREERFHYGTNSEEDGHLLGVDEEDQKSVLIGDIAVDENIDKLREVIGSVDNTLSRCLASSGGTGKAQRERQLLHMQIVHGLDSWEGMRGQFVSQRALMKGIAGIEQSSEIFEDSHLGLIDDISWQTSLANSAVSAAEDVRSAVRVSRTAANAKAAASSAAMSAQQSCDNGKFASIDEARAAQTRAAIAQSHAIHAAVVEHEAKTVKRRAALALANDVKCWNVHRKRETLRAVLAHARSQHEATRRAVDAWSSFRDGFIGSTVIPSAPDSMLPRQEPPKVETPVPYSFCAAGRALSDQDEVTATIFEEPSQESPSIVAVEHNVLAQPDDLPEMPKACEPSTDDESPVTSERKAKQNDVSYKPEPSSIFPFATADPVDQDGGQSGVKEADLLGLGNDASFHDAESRPVNEGSGNNDPMSSSFESLLEGLMSWGGGFDTEEDHFNLPVGMAASIMLEESGAMDSSKIA